MSGPMLPNKAPRRRVIARSSDGRVIYAARIHNPAENMWKGWDRTGRSLRTAIDVYDKTKQ